MDVKLRLKAIEDVLDFCRSTSHQINTGKLLAPALLGRQWADENDDGEMAEVVQGCIETELCRLRTKWGIKHALPNTLDGIAEQLRLDEAVGDDGLTALAFTWAFYIAAIDTARLATMASCHKRTVNYRVAAGRKELTEFIFRHGTVDGSSFHTIGQDRRDGKEAIAVPDVDHPSERTHDEPSIFSPHRQHMHVKADRDVHFYTAPVTQTIVHTTPSTPSSQGKDATKGDDQLESAIFLLTLIAAFCLVSTLPWVSIGIILLVTCWRVAIHVVQCVEQWRTNSNVEQRWWHICYTIPWLVLLVLTINTALTAQHSLATPLLSIEHLTVIMHCIAVGGFLILLGTIDLLFWVQRSGEVNWPWSLLISRATWAWEQRWLAAGISWLVLLGIGVVWFMISNLPLRSFT